MVRYSYSLQGGNYIMQTLLIGVIIGLIAGSIVTSLYIDGVINLGEEDEDFDE